MFGKTRIECVGKRLGLCALILLLALVAVMPAARGAVPRETAEVLRFDAAGNFKIMVIADIQDGARVNPYTIELITLALAQEQPDLVVLDGDNIFGLVPSLIISRANVRRSIDAFLAPIVESGTPFALVFGNHDPETIMSKAEQMAYYQGFAGCVAQAGEIADRAGNYQLLVCDDNDVPALNLWFLDSGNKAKTEHGSGYAYVLDEQMAWYAQKGEELKVLNEGKTIPAVLFQHIPVPEIYDLLSIAAEGTEGAVQGHGIYSEKYYVLNDSLVSDGALNEGPCPPDYNNGQFAGWLAQRDIMAAVFGHDHVNDFRGTLKGIELMHTAGAGFYDYGNGYQHGVRVMEFHKDAVQDYTTRMVYWEELTDKQIPEKLLYKGAFWYGDVYIYFGLIALIVIALVLVVVLVARKVRKKKKAVQQKTKQIS